jgi:Fic family protein
MKKHRITGEYRLLGQQNHFIPKPLPPSEPVFQVDNNIMTLYGQAMHMLGSLNEMMHRIPDKERFLKAYIWKEAILTSDIEGIHTTLLDLLSQPYGVGKYGKDSNGKASISKKDTQLVINYTHALEHAMHLIRNKEMPIVSRVLQEAHAKLLAGEGDHSAPGEFRKQQVKVGNLVPPQANYIPNLIAELEKYINNDNSLPPLIKAGLAHVQFETIHPFLDGNGRIGRLLIILIMVKEAVLTEPLLYPSYFFKKYHAEYYERLDKVRTNGDFEGWIEYYLKAIAESAEDATKNAHEIEQLEKKLLSDIKNSRLFIRSLNEAQEFLTYLFKNPVISITEAAKELGKQYNSIKEIVRKFEQLGILQKHSEAQRNKSYKFSEYIELLS